MRRLLYVTLAVIWPSIVLAADGRDLVAPDARMVISVNVGSLTASPLAKMEGSPIRTLATSIAESSRLLDLGPTTPIERLWIIVGESYPKGTLVVAQGKFDPDRLRRQVQELARTRKPNVRVLWENETAVLSFDVPHSIQPIPGVPGTAMLASSGTELILAAFEKETLVSAINRATTSSSAAPTIATLLDKLDNTAAISWVALVPPALSGQKAALAGADQIIGSVQLDRGIVAKCTITTNKGAEEAKAMASRLSDGLAETQKLLPTLSQSSVDPKVIAWLSSVLNAIKMQALPHGVEIVIVAAPPTEKSKP